MLENRRQSNRFSFYEPIGYQRNRELPMAGTVAEDISPTGLKIVTNEFIALHTLLELQIQLPGQAQLYQISAKVVWVREAPNRQDSWQVGLQVVSSQPELSSGVKEYIGLRRFDTA